MAAIWLVDQNPFQLPPPPEWWQQLVFDYDKMLRVIPSQRERAYRLCRIVRREARLGLQAAIVHDHPDTRACIKFGVVPVATLPEWAVRTPTIIRDLEARDTWKMHGGDPMKIADAIEGSEAAEAAKVQLASDEHLDAINSDTYRQIRYGFRALSDVGQAHQRATNIRANTLPALKPLPKLPTMQGASVLQSDAPPVASPAAGIVLTD